MRCMYLKWETFFVFPLVWMECFDKLVWPLDKSLFDRSWHLILTRAGYGHSMLWQVSVLCYSHYMNHKSWQVSWIFKLNIGFRALHFITNIFIEYRFWTKSVAWLPPMIILPQFPARTFWAMLTPSNKFLFGSSLTKSDFQKKPKCTSQKTFRDGTMCSYEEQSQYVSSNQQIGRTPERAGL